jgi:hypothetical protein
MARQNPDGNCGKCGVGYKVSQFVHHPFVHVVVVVVC